MGKRADIRWLSVLGLTVWEAGVLQTLLGGETLSCSDVQAAARRDGFALSEEDVDDLLCSTRRKLERYGVELDISRSRMFSISALDREALDDIRQSVIIPAPFPA